MDFRGQNQGDPADQNTILNPPPIPESPFSKPLLPSPPSLLPNRLAGARNNAAHPSPDSSPAPASYRECLRNHAASIGGHVLDGCGEFMPGAADSMKCAACSCHRSFHRRESQNSLLFHRRRVSNSGDRIPLLLPPATALQNQIQIQSFCAAESSSEELGLGVLSSKKRFRTKFTEEQKVKMMEFAERIGWRIQRQDEVKMERFLAEIGISRRVFKVWMHNNNNKQSIRKQQKLLDQNADGMDLCC